VTLQGRVCEPELIGGRQPRRLRRPRSISLSYCSRFARGERDRLGTQASGVFAAESSHQPDRGFHRARCDAGPSIERKSVSLAVPARPIHNGGGGEEGAGAHTSVSQHIGEPPAVRLWFAAQTRASALVMRTPASRPAGRWLGAVGEAGPPDVGAAPDRDSLSSAVDAHGGSRSISRRPLPIIG